MQIDILTLFPGMFKGPLSESIIKIAQKKGKLKIKLHNLRKWTSDRHRTADDKPFGGGGGMVIKVEPVYWALKEIAEIRKKGLKIILLTPQGKRFDQKVVKRLSKLKRLVLICGHYEGVDERIRKLVDEEISIGDYILSCGEMPACVIVDSVTRLLPGVLGNPKSSNIETFENNLLEYPQYTRPRVFEGVKVPKVLLGGNHNDIENWRRERALKRTKKKRPDLYRRRNG
ncbi:MAG: tRNA (guanosine(37)-N1)-methyltransferase TrmD [Candidatus Omnitrophica bacterium]|nr:tRNA (guanosine(37)-N1)-methyltransferase TrmD [Candidatus Omnitrophota bacterium]